jgi:adenosylhomocysteine nucleosidase
MQADCGRSRSNGTASPRNSSSHIALIAALRVEVVPVAAQLLRCPGAAVRIHQCGPGAERAERAARAALDAGASALLSWGFAGGLGPELRCGTALLPAGVRLSDGRLLPTDSRWCEGLLEIVHARCAVERRTLIVSDQVLETPEDKAALPGLDDAVAVDMESGALARVASEAGVPFAVLRVIVDEATDRLPTGVDGWVDAAGRPRLRPAMMAALSPGQWRSLVTLTGRYRVARAALRTLSQLLVPHEFARAVLVRPAY